MEVSEADWRADALASRGLERVAFEVQWSSIDPETQRQARLPTYQRPLAGQAYLPAVVQRRRRLPRWRSSVKRLPDFEFARTV
jgi:hypothetical protein